MATIRVFILFFFTMVLFSGCATIVNDPNIPIAASFSDGSSGECDFRNKRGFWSTQMPTNGVMIRRSDDALIYNCTTEDDRTATGSIQSETEGGKMAASVLFWDLGITDAITDKHRTYQRNIVIPIVRAKQMPVVQEDQPRQRARTNQTYSASTAPVVRSPTSQKKNEIVSEVVLPSIAAGCKPPSTPGSIPENAGHTELLSTKRELEFFQKENAKYQSCIEDSSHALGVTEGNRKAITTAHNMSVTIEEALVSEFNNAYEQWEANNN